MGNLIVTAPNSPQGQLAIEHLSGPRGLRDLAVSYQQSLSDRLSNLASGVYLRELRHSFHLIEVADGDELRAINRVLQWHNGEGQPRSLHGRIDSVEPNITFLPQASLGLPFTLGGFHPSYMQLMKVYDAHQCSVMGKDIVVAVVDSGADPNMKKPVDDFYDIQQGTPVHPAIPIDNDGHGTAMATLIQEVAPEAKVFAVRVFKENKVNLWNLLAGAGVAAFDCNADIVSLSLGYKQVPENCGTCGASTQSRLLAFQYLLDGISQSPGKRRTPAIYLAATGNDSLSDRFNYPAAYDSAVAIGAVTSKLERSLFSNYGKDRPTHFFVAPGGQRDLTNAVIEDVGKGIEGSCFGTSVATAYAAGMFALLWSDPRYQGQPRDLFLSSIKSDHTISLPESKGDTHEYGSGLIQYHQANQTDKPVVDVTARVEWRDGVLYVGGMRIWPPYRFKNRAKPAEKE
jgi:subtilisin family serine protease